MSPVSFYYVYTFLNYLLWLWFCASILYSSMRITVSNCNSYCNSNRKQFYSRYDICLFHIWHAQYCTLCSMITLSIIIIYARICTLLLILKGAADLKTITPFPFLKNPIIWNTLNPHWFLKVICVIPKDHTSNLIIKYSYR